MADARGSDCGDEEPEQSGGGDSSEALERRLERLRPREKSDEELNELAPVTETCRPAGGQEAGEGSVTDGEGDAQLTATGDECTPFSDGDVDSAVAAVNEVAPVTDALRPAGEQTDSSVDSARETGDSRVGDCDAGEGDAGDEGV